MPIGSNTTDPALAAKNIDDRTKKIEMIREMPDAHSSPMKADKENTLPQDTCTGDLSSLSKAGKGSRE